MIFGPSKRAGKREEKPHYEPIHMPKNSALGIYIGAFSFLFGFAVIWQILRLSIVGLIGIIACLMLRLADRSTDSYVTVEEIERIERQRGQI